MISTRCSALDRIAECPASAQRPEVQIDFDSEAARMGTAVDDGISSLITEGQYDATEIAPKYRLDVIDVAKALDFATDAWFKVKEFIPNPQVHPELAPYTDRGVTLTGTPDLIGYDGETLYVLDFKSGWKDGEHWSQLKGYGLLALRPGVQKIVLLVLHTRLGVIDRKDMTVAELFAWWNSFVDKLLAEPERHSPGNACVYCPRAHECQARKQMVKDTVFWMTETDGDKRHDLDGLEPKHFADVLDRCRMIESVCKSLREFIKTEVANAGGVLPYSDTHELAVETGERETIDVAEGWDILEQYLGDDWVKAASISKSAVERIVGMKSPPRGKAKAMRDLMDGLRNVDALKITTVEKLVQRKRSLPLVTQEV